MNMVKLWQPGESAVNDHLRLGLKMNLLDSIITVTQTCLGPMDHITKNEQPYLVL